GDGAHAADDFGRCGVQQRRPARAEVASACGAVLHVFRRASRSLPRPDLRARSRSRAGKPLHKRAVSALRAGSSAHHQSRDPQRRIPASRRAQRRGDVHRVDVRVDESASAQSEACASRGGCESHRRFVHSRAGEEEAMKWVAGLLGCLMLAACTTGRDPGTSDAPALAWVPPASAVPPALPKQVPSDLGTLTMAKAIDTALQNNPQTRIAWLQAQQARSIVGSTESALYPELNFGLGYVRARQATQGGKSVF